MSTDPVFKSAADEFADSFPPPYRNIRSNLKSGCFFPVMGRWEQGIGYTVVRGDLIQGLEYYPGAIVLRCLSRIHSVDLTVTVTYRKTVFVGYQSSRHDDKIYQDPLYDIHPTMPTDTITIQVPAYSERGSIHLGTIGDAYGIVSVDVSSVHSDSQYLQGMPGDSFEVCITSSPIVIVGLALGEQFEGLRKQLEYAFNGRFVHLKQCATCEGTGKESTHGGTTLCPICGGTGTVASDEICPNCLGRTTVCPTCLGAKVDEHTSRLFYQIQRSKDLRARKKAVDENPKITAMRMWSRRRWVHSTREIIKQEAAFFTGCPPDQVEIVERFDDYEPLFFILVPYFGGPLNLFGFGLQNRNDLIEWAETVRPVGIHVITGVYYPISEDASEHIKDEWEDAEPYNQQGKLSIEDSPYGLFGEWLGLPLSPLDTGKQPLLHDRSILGPPLDETGISDWSPIPVSDYNTKISYSSLFFNGIPMSFRRDIDIEPQKGSAYFYVKPVFDFSVPNSYYRIHLHWDPVITSPPDNGRSQMVLELNGGNTDTKGNYMTFSAPFNTNEEDQPSPNSMRLYEGQWLYFFVKFDLNRKKLWITVLCIEDNTNPVATVMTKTSILNTNENFSNLTRIRFSCSEISDNYVSEFCLFNGDLN